MADILRLITQTILFALVLEALRQRKFVYLLLLCGFLQLTLALAIWATPKLDKMEKFYDSTNQRIESIEKFLPKEE